MGTGGRAGGGVDTPHCTAAPAPNGPLVSFRRSSHLAGCNLASGCATARQMSHPARPGGHDSDDSRIWLAAVWLLAVQLRHYGKQEFQGRHKPTATKGEIPLLSPAPRGLCAPSVPGAAKASAGGCGDLREPHASPPGHARPAAAVAAPFSKKPLISPLERFRISGGRLSGRRAEVPTSKKMAAYSRGRSRRSPSLKRSEVLGTFSVSDARPPPQATSTTLDSL